MKKMYLYRFNYKDYEGNEHYDTVVAKSFKEALNIKYPKDIPNFEYVSSQEVDVILPDE